VNRLVYFEEFRSVENAIARETRMKGWLRAKKIALIERENALWKDLAGDWYELAPPPVIPSGVKNSVS
jgi:putative endonuclease